MSPRPTSPVRRRAPEPERAPLPTLPRRVPTLPRISADHRTYLRGFAQRTFMQRTFSQRTFSQRTSDRRALARRLLVRRVVLRVGIAAAVVGLAAWVLLASPLLAVRTVEVTGTTRLPAAEVAALVEPARDVPLARVDAGELERQVGALPAVRSVDVSRGWPSTLRVRVVERLPIAAVPAEGGVQLVDRDGVVVATATEPPADMPVVQVDVATAGSAAVREAAAVLNALPAELRLQVEQVSAATRDSVTLALRGGSQVLWGSADDSARKAAVLGVLLQRPAEVYDVSAPETPVTR